MELFDIDALSRALQKFENDNDVTFNYAADEHGGYRVFVTSNKDDSTYSMLDLIDTLT